MLSQAWEGTTYTVGVRVLSVGGRFVGNPSRNFPSIWLRSFFPLTRTKHPSIVHHLPTQLPAHRFASHQIRAPGWPDELADLFVFIPGPQTPFFFFSEMRHLVEKATPAIRRWLATWPARRAPVTARPGPARTRSLPAIFARGGTSNGLLIQRANLPPEAECMSLEPCTLSGACGGACGRAEHSTEHRG